MLPGLAGHGRRSWASIAQDVAEVLRAADLPEVDGPAIGHEARSPRQLEVLRLLAVLLDDLLDVAGAHVLAEALLIQPRLPGELDEAVLELAVRELGPLVDVVVDEARVLVGLPLTTGGLDRVGRAHERARVVKR